MAAKRVSPVKKTMARKMAAPPSLSEEATIVVLESMQTLTPTNASVDPDLRRQLVAAEAYYLAERRGFEAGNELADWVTAEKLVDSRLQTLVA
jgi:Protein of unknown function (DUF2934)